MALKRFSQMIRKILKWLFQYVGTVDIEEVIDHKITLENHLEMLRSKAEDFKEPLVEATNEDKAKRDDLVIIKCANSASEIMYLFLRYKLK